jgi:glycosyltransferase involved in cell wall biosynthesis
MVRSGLPEENVYVKPNFVVDPLSDLKILPKRADQVMFVGRLAQEKGADLLLEAWARILGPPKPKLIIVGDGPERTGLERKYGNLPGVLWRGWLQRKQLLREVAASRFLVVPSRWYEGFPMVVIESLSLGTPVIAPGHAGFPEIITSDRTGLLFSPGNQVHLAEVLKRALRLDEASWWQWSKNARNLYLERYTPEANYPLLMAIYEKAISHATKKQGGV